MAFACRGRHASNPAVYMHTQRYACRYNWRSGQRRVLSTCCFQLSQLSHRPLPLLPLCHVGQGVLCQEPVARLSDGKELGTVRLNRCSANARFLRGQSVAGQGYHDLRIYCARSTQCFPNVSSSSFLLITSANNRSPCFSMSMSPVITNQRKAVLERSHLLATQSAQIYSES